MNAPNNGTVTDPTAPTGHPTPSAIVLPVLAVLACFLCVPPLAAHTTTRNLAATVLVAAILVENVQNAINALIWPRYPLDNKWDGQGLPKK
jgi:hypothetical protein